jgi:DNA-binding LacI/PurR family transcriptional regulator
MARLSDVAAEAGVSVSTASRVLADNGYASAEARRRVLAAARALGYSPNHIARSLRLQRTQALGLVIADLENFFYSQVARGVADIARQRDYHVVLATTDEDPHEEVRQLELLRRLRVDGVIITPTGVDHEAVEDELELGLVPLVQVDRRIPGIERDAVLVDNVGAARLAVRHLVEVGHRRIGILAGDQRVTTGQERLRGFLDELAAQGIQPDPALVHTTAFTRSAAVGSATSLMSVEPRPTAIVTANNILCEGVVRAANALGLDIPGDLSLLSFDDAPWMSLLPAPISVIDQPAAEMGSTAATLLFNRLDGLASSEPRNIVLRPTLQLRASVAHRDPS